MSRRPGTSDASFDLKRAAVRAVEQGKPQREVARLLGISAQSVSVWWRRYRRGGLEARKPRHRPGRPRRLSGRQLHRLVFYLARGPSAYGFRGEFWTLRRIAAVIRKEFAVSYHPGHVWRLLQRIGFSRQKPERRAINRDEDLIYRWRTRVWPQYRRQIRRQGLTIYFLDEAGRTEIPTVVATWAPRGETPILRHLGRWDKVSVISAVSPRGRLHYRIHLGSLGSDHVIDFLERLQRRTRGKIRLFWDGGGLHTSRVVHEYLKAHRSRLEVRRLPPYAPELNPTEQLWRRAKYDERANSCPLSKEALIVETRRAREQLRRRPHLIPSFFEHAGLPLTSSAGPGLTIH